MKALRVKHPTSEPSETSLSRTRRQAIKYNETTFYTGPQLLERAKDYAEQLEKAEKVGDPTEELADDLAEIWMVAHDFVTVIHSDVKIRRDFAATCKFIEVQCGLPLFIRVLDQIPEIATGRASLGIQKLAYHILFVQRPSFEGSNRGELEDALYRAARVWYRQPTDQYFTNREYKQRQGKFGTYEVNKYRLRFSEMTSIKRETGECMIKAYLYQAVAVGCEPGDNLDRARHYALKRSLAKKPKAIQRLILHDLPPACARAFQ